MTPVTDAVAHVFCSTLDPALRMEKKLFPDPRGLALLAVGVLYLLATPGVLPGFWDTYISAPFQRARAPAYGPVRPLPLFEENASTLGKGLHTHLYEIAYQVDRYRNTTID